MRTLISGLSNTHANARAAILAVVGLFATFAAPTAYADQTVQLTPGSTITLSVTASGTPPFAYQWRKNGASLPGANQSTLVLSSVTSADVGEYSATVSNSAGLSTSDIAFVTPPSEPIIPPAILVHPSNQTVQLDGEAIFSVTAGGSVPLVYQWKKNGVDVPGANEPTLSIDPVTDADFGNYTVVVSNAAGSTESSESSLAVLTDVAVQPSFASQLFGQAALTGDTIVFSIVASGTAPISYQWRINGKNLANSAIVSGSDGPSLTLTNVNPTYSAFYSVIATNSAGSVESNIVELTVSNPPTKTQAPLIVTNPDSKIAAIGETLSFSGSATALPEASYQWQKDGVDLNNVGNVLGADTNTLTLYGVRATDGGKYTLIATNTVGTATSQPATLIVKDVQAPLFISQPASQTANVGSVAFFSTKISAFPAPTYQWRKNGVDLVNDGKIQGANKPTISISNLSAADAGTYTVVVSNALGTVISNDAMLTTDGTPAFTGQPAFVSQPPATTIASAGAVVQLVVSVAGDPLPTLQWRKNGTNLTNGGIVSGATSATLTLTGVTAADAATYTVVATNSLGAITSSPFEVSVLPSNVWNQPATAGKDVALSGPGASTAVQWQISADTGATWTNLTDNSTYSGVATSTLHVANVSSSLNSLLYRLITVADGKTTVLHSAKLSVASAFVPFPVSISADGSGNLYVADASNDTIEKITISSQIATLAGTAGQTGIADGTGSTARFNDPTGVAAAFDGTLAVTDKANGTVRIITPAGVVSTLAGSTTLRGNVDGTGSSATFSSPSGITRDSSGNFYIADAMNHTIRKVTPAGAVTTFAGSAGQSGTTDGVGIAARFNSPTGIDIDPSGNLFVSDTTNNLIRKVSSTGTVTTVAGVSGVSGSTDGAGNVALFNQPAGIAVDNVGNVYVADTGNSTVRRISPAGAVVTIAGLPGIAGHKDGVGIEAWLNQPRDVAVSSGGVYVADTGNASIRKIDQDGKVTTVALVTPPSTDNPPSQPLPTPPSLPTTPSTPTLPTSPTPPSQSSGGGGGGSPSVWFCSALMILWLTRSYKRR
jgi:hypothetical protein